MKKGIKIVNRNELAVLIILIILVAGLWIWNNFHEDIRQKCCAECSRAFSYSPVDVGAEGLECTHFISGGTSEEFFLSKECAEYFHGHPATVAECEQNECNIDSDCKFECGCGCISKDKICSFRVFCKPTLCGAACRCLDGKCTSWTDVYSEALETNNTVLCNEIENLGCKTQCLESLTKKQVTITIKEG
jgi:hypothetical protein